MHVRTDSLEEEIRVTVDAAMELANTISDREPDLTGRLRGVLVDHDFVRAAAASDAELEEFADRCVPFARLVVSLPDARLVDAVVRVNASLETSAIAPSLSAHDGFALHIHWTSPTTPFAHQVVVDLLMALAQTLCDHGLERFGRCAADECDHVFYDTTKNRSRRFCSDPRCASRTHTAAHRARRSAGG
jgi:CBS domain-containing protein